MSFLRKKNIDGKDYWYQVKSIREGKKVIQKHIKYWGTEKPSKTQMVKIDELYKKGKLKEIKKKPIPKKKIVKQYPTKTEIVYIKGKGYFGRVWLEGHPNNLAFPTDFFSNKSKAQAEVDKIEKNYLKKFEAKPKKKEPKEEYSGWDRENISKDIIAFFDKSENEITVAKMSTGEWEVNPSTIIFESKRFKSKKEAMDFAKEQMQKNSPEKPKVEYDPKKDPKRIAQDKAENRLIDLLHNRPELKPKDVKAINQALSKGKVDEANKLIDKLSKMPKPKKKDPELPKSDFVSEKLRREDRPQSKWANVEDIDIDRLYHGAVNTYSDPSGVAIKQQNSYVKAVNGFANELMEIAETPEQIKQAEIEIQKYKENYLKKYLAKVDADSRTASTFITGASNFPHKQNQKRLDVAHKRMGEFIQWEEKAKPRAIKNVEKAFTGDLSKRELEALKKSANIDLDAVQGIDNKTDKMRGFDRSAFVNSLSGKLERQLKNGNVKLVEQTLDYVKEQEEKRGMKKPIFSKRHGIFKKLEKAKTEKPIEKPTGIKKIQDYNGVSVVNNHDEDRIQLLFDEKPNEEIRKELKHNGWHWSNKNEAWQRKSTANAITDSRILLGKHFEVD